MAKKKFFHAEQDLPTTNYDTEYVQFTVGLVVESSTKINEINKSGTELYMLHFNTNPLITLCSVGLSSIIKS